MSQPARILLSLVAGLALGIAAAAFAAGAAPALVAVLDVVGTLWLNGLRMTIVPLVVALLVTGIARTAAAARAGRVAAAALAGILAIMALSAVIGVLVTPLLLSLAPLPAGAAAAMRHGLGAAAPVAPPPAFADTLRALVPTNVIDAAAKTDILPLLVFFLAFAFAVTRLDGRPRALITDFFAATADALVIVVGWVLRLAPVGVFALAFAVGARSGAAVLGTLLHYVLVVTAVGGVVLLLAYPLAVLGGRVPLGRFARAALPAQALALSTESSLACLPITLEQAQGLGAPEPKAALVLPMAVALMRATGPAMNIAAALYVARLTGTPVPVGAGVLAVFVGAVSSMGSVSLPGTITFFTNIAPVCLALGIPLQPLALLVAVETFPDLMRTLGNVTANLALTVTVARVTRD